MPEARPLEHVVEALLYLSPESVSTTELAEACEASEAEIDRALDLLGAALAEGRRGLVLREVAGGFALAADPAAEDAAPPPPPHPQSRSRPRSPRRRPRPSRSSPTSSRSPGRRSRASAASRRSRRRRRS